MSMKPLADCRLYTFVDAGYLNKNDPVEIARQLIDGGADILQLRAKDWSKDRIQSTAESLLQITESAQVPLVVNDHPDIASATGAQYYHQGQEEFFGETGESRLEAEADHTSKLGLSTHSPTDAQRAMQTQAAYLAAGPIHPTPTKPGRPGVGLGYIRWAAAQIDRPWFAIGGITLENVDDVLAAGARRICIVSAILNAPDISRACQQFRERLASVPL